MQGINNIQQVNSNIYALKKFINYRPSNNLCDNSQYIMVVKKIQDTVVLAVK